MTLKTSKKKIETRGRKNLIPTKEQRDTVKLLRASGWIYKEIALAVGVDENTLMKHFWTELHESYVEKKSHILELLEKNAEKGNVAAQKALLAHYQKGELTAIAHRPTAKLQEPEPKAEKIGKKDQLNIDAKTASKGTAWQDHLTKQ